MALLYGAIRTVNIKHHNVFFVTPRGMNIVSIPTVSVGIFIGREHLIVE